MRNRCLTYYGSAMQTEYGPSEPACLHAGGGQQYRICGGRQIDLRIDTSGRAGQKSDYPLLLQRWRHW